MKPPFTWYLLTLGKSNDKAFCFRGIQANTAGEEGGHLNMFQIRGLVSLSFHENTGSQMIIEMNQKMEVLNLATKYLARGI